MDQACQLIDMQSPDELCNNTDCVWPGDSDGDQKANNYDLLNIGLGFGSMGPQRTVFPVEDDPIAWAPNYSDDWSQSIGAVNFKHLDCDGNGVVDDADVLAISNNYTPDFEYTSEPVDNAPPIYLEFEDSEIFIDEDTPDSIFINIRLMLGSTDFPATDLHGIALSFEFPIDLIFPSTIQFTYNENSFFGNVEETLEVKQDLGIYSIGRYDLGLSRKAGDSIDGIGEIGTLGMVVSSDIIDGLEELQTTFDVLIDKVLMINAVGDDLLYSIPSPMPNLTFINDTVANIDVEAEEEASVQVFPNPVKNNLQLISKSTTIEQVILRNTQGKLVFQQSNKESSASLDVSAYPKGIYFLQVHTPKGIRNHRVLIK